MINKSLKNRGAGLNPQNRFEQLYVDYNDENIEYDEYLTEDEKKIPTQFFVDNSKSILAKNDSPDLGFTYSINPYRGCEHGCIYCYARPSHEFLGFSSGIDFETKIMVKMDCAKLLDEAFQDKKWTPQTIMVSGNTDCYQPVERKLQLTRRLLEVFLKYKNPLGMITKNAMIQRDIDLLKQLAELNLVSVTLSITTLDRELSRKMEPRTSVPSQRLAAVEALAKNGIPVGVNVAPVIPGLNDEEIPAILKESAERGASRAGKVMLRLSYANKDLFIDWINRTYPGKASKVVNRIKDVRNGKLSDSTWNLRMSGTGEIAETISQLFRASVKKYHLNEMKGHLTTEHFERNAGSPQIELF
jgi:DNA repair photolyase